MSSSLLQGTRARYSVDESGPDDPSAEHYAAARRWLAGAREARDWALEASPRTESYFWARVCDALVCADAHRALARRWRRPSDSTTPLEGDDALRHARARERLRRILSIEACFAAARRAIHLARAYRYEPGSSGRRERECLDQIARWRSAIRELRAEERLALHGPGLRKAAALDPIADEGATAEARGRAS